MVIALLAVLGVDLVVIVVLVVCLLARRRWVRHQPGVFAGAVRAADGEVHGLGRRWHRGQGRWVSDVLVWTRAPFLLRNELVPVDALLDRRPAQPHEVTRLGDHPVVIRLRTGGATVEVAAAGDAADLLLGPFRAPARAPAGAPIGAPPVPRSPRAGIAARAGRAAGPS